jgi:hypothetical protein
VELACTRLSTNLQRRFVLYLSGTQPQADKHVQNIGAMLERIGTERAVNAYGASRGWQHSELRTAKGFNVIALGLDVAAVRGIKVDEYRPDLIILDDFDSRLDSELTRRKKVEAITTSILPAGSADCAVIAVQNLIDVDSLMSTLVDGRADWLQEREVSTIEPAVRGLQVEHVITADGARYAIAAGEPTWAGQGLAVCEQQINTWGLRAFLREAQHAVEQVEGGLWEMARDIESFRTTTHPELLRIVVALDPNATSGGDEAGIVAAGIARNEHVYVLEDATIAGGPKRWAEQAVAVYNRLRANTLVAEANNGGDMVAITIGTVKNAPPVKLIHASRGKLTRAEPVQKLYTDGQVHHVGRFPLLERELCTWAPGLPSPNRLDALVWAVTEVALMGQPNVRWLD